jgi:hypothetical protein
LRGSAIAAPNSSAVTAVDVKENTTMAEGQSMTVADVVAKTMDGRLVTPMSRWVRYLRVSELCLWEVEVAACGACRRVFG